MKLRYKHIHFAEYKKEGIAYIMHNIKTGLAMGAVSFRPQWKRFVIEFTENCIFDTQCLKDIVEFLEQLKEAKMLSTAKSRQVGKKEKLKLFPVFESKGFDLRKVPWGILEGHEAQALINHDQTLERLAERGGLTLVEMACILNNSRYDRKMSGVRAYEFILAHIEAWNRRLA